MKSLKHLLAIGAFLLAAFAFSSCDKGSEPESHIYFLTVNSDECTVNYSNNLFLTMIVNEVIAEKNKTMEAGIMTLSQAEKELESAANEILKMAAETTVPVLEDSKCALALSHSVSNPGESFPIVKTKIITFTPTSK